MLQGLLRSNQSGSSFSSQAFLFVAHADGACSVMQVFVAWCRCALRAGPWGTKGQCQWELLDQPFFCWKFLDLFLLLRGGGFGFPFFPLTLSSSFLQCFYLSLWFPGLGHLQLVSSSTAVITLSITFLSRNKWNKITSRSTSADLHFSRLVAVSQAII